MPRPVEPWREERLARRREVYAAQSDDQREDRLARRREVYAAQSDDQRGEASEKTRRLCCSVQSPEKREACLERFPKLSVTTQANGINECIRCGNDKHIPKLFSSANNMDLGAVPPQLQVYNTCSFIIIIVGFLSCTIVTLL